MHQPQRASFYFNVQSPTPNICGHILCICFLILASFRQVQHYFLHLIEFEAKLLTLFSEIVVFSGLVGAFFIIPSLYLNRNRSRRQGFVDTEMQNTSVNDNPVKDFVTETRTGIVNWYPNAKYTNNMQVFRFHLWQVVYYPFCLSLSTSFQGALDINYKSILDIILYYPFDSFIWVLNWNHFYVGIDTVSSTEIYHFLGHFSATSYATRNGSQTCQKVDPFNSLSCQSHILWNEEEYKRILYFAKA